MHKDRYAHYYPQQKKSLIDTLKEEQRSSAARNTDHVMCSTYTAHHAKSAIIPKTYSEDEEKSGREFDQQELETYACLPYVARITDRLKKTEEKKYYRTVQYCQEDRTVTPTKQRPAS